MLTHVLTLDQHPLFNTIYNCSHQHRFKLKEDKNILEAEEREKEENDYRRDMRRSGFLNDHSTLHDNNTTFMNNIDKNWKKTQLVKKNRKIRDLQYELALNKMDELKQTCARNHYSTMNKDGVVEFEKIMTRSGLGADGADGHMSVTYEDGEAFISRMEHNAKTHHPTNEECSDFMNQLKTRTEEKRAARYEKERRRRRAVLSQENNAND